MSTLQELCFSNIAKTIANTPVMIQEEIIGTSTAIITKEITDNITTKVTAETRVHIKRNLSDFYANIVPSMVIDIVSATKTGRNRLNYRNLYPDMDQVILEDAISAAELIANVCVIQRMETGEDNFEAWMDM